MVFDVRAAAREPQRNAALKIPRNGREITFRWCLVGGLLMESDY